MSLEVTCAISSILFTTSLGVGTNTTSGSAQPVALSASYLRAPAAGPVALTDVPGPAGRTLAHSSVTLSDAGGPALTVQATTATLDHGPSDFGHPMPEVPSVEECFSLAEHRPVMVSTVG